MNINITSFYERSEIEIIMTKAELEKENKKLKEQNQILYKLLEQEQGYDAAHELINRANMEYAVMKTNEKLERRDW